MKLQQWVWKTGWGMLAVVLWLTVGCSTFSGNRASENRVNEPIDPPVAYDTDSNRLPAPGLDTPIRQPPPSRGAITDAPTYREPTPPREPKPARTGTSASARPPRVSDPVEDIPIPYQDEPTPTRTTRTRPVPPADVEIPELEPTERGGSSDIVRVGDILTIEFSGPAAPPANQSAIRVGSSGKISLPLLKRQIVVTNLTVDQISQNISHAYVGTEGLFRFLTVNVSVGNRFYSVDGEVKSPNKYPFTDEVTVLGAIAQASGLTDFANEKKIYIIRGSDKSVEQFNYDKAKKNPKKYDLKVLPGDQIFVPRGYL